MNQYYPFGMENGEEAGDQTEVTYQDYLFGGKEFNGKFELNMYDFGARNYDAARGQWTTMDPRAENYYSISPYAYCGNNPISRFDPNGMDWIENGKTGDVEWRPDATKDQVPDGWKYIGTEYKGISIYSFNKTNYQTETGHFADLEIRIGYKDGDSKEKFYNWIQTYKRDGEKSPSVDIEDSEEGSANYPYYQSVYENEKSKNINGYDIVYYDAAQERQANGSFSAELSLIGAPYSTASIDKYWNTIYNVPYRKNIYTPIITLKYGFNVTNGVLKPTPIRVVNPSIFQLKTINQIK